MNRPDPALVAMARRVLVDERGAGDGAAAAGRMLDGLHLALVPLMGSAGVGALLVRSAKLTRIELPFLTLDAVESGAKLRACLQAQDEARATEAAVALFGALLTLMMTFIGERLTTQVLRRAWPTIEDAAPRETRS